MSDDGRVFGEVLSQLAGAQQSLNQVPLSAEQRRLNAEQVQREENRFQQGREDSTTNQARTIALQNIAEINEAIAALDPTDPLVPRLNRALQQQQQALTLTGEAALEAVTTGTIEVPGQTIRGLGPRAPMTPPSLSQAGSVMQGGPAPRPIGIQPESVVTMPDEVIPTGQVIAAGGQAARAATERRERSVREEQRTHEIFINQMGFDFQDLTREDQQAFQQLQNEADRLLQEGLATDQIANQLLMQANELGFRGGQGTLERALRRYEIDTQAELERSRMDATQSATATDRIIERIKLLNPEVEEDRIALEGIVASAEEAGLQPYDMLTIQSAAAAQDSEGARLGFQNLKATIEGLDAQTAVNQAQAGYTDYQKLSGEAKDAQARASDAATFVMDTAARGKAGIGTLQGMLGAIQTGNIENSPWSGFLQHLDAATIEGALVKAQELAESEELDRAVLMAEAGNSLMSGRAMSIDTIASMYSPEQIRDIANMTNEELGDDWITRKVRDTLLTTGSMERAITKATIRETAEELQMAGPKLSYAEAMLEYYKTQRPEDVEVGADAVRSALQVMADAGLLGDPEDPDGQREQIERTVSFYRQAWGDSGEAFDAELAKLASETALADAQANKLIAEATADGGVSLEVLTFQKDLIDGQIARIESTAELMGCTVTAQGIRVGDSGVCDSLAMETASSGENYNALLMATGFRTVDDIEYEAWIADLTKEAQEKLGPEATPEEVEEEVKRRVWSVTAGFRKVPTSGLPIHGPPTNPDAPSGPPMSAREAGAAAGQAVWEAGGNVGRAIGEGASSVAGWVSGFVSPDSVPAVETDLGQDLRDRWSAPNPPRGSSGAGAGGGSGSNQGGPFSSRVPAVDASEPFADYADDANGLLDALVWQESRGKHTNSDGTLLTSGAGAQGITQVMPDTGKSPGHGVTPLQDETEAEYLRFGRDYLAALLEYYGGDKEKALAAYNTGTGNVNAAVKAAKDAGDEAEWLANLSDETQQYVPSIMNRVAGNG